MARLSVNARPSLDFRRISDHDLDRRIRARLQTGAAAARRRVVRRVIARIGGRGAMLAGLAFGVVALAVMGLSPTPWLFAAGLPLMALIDLFGPGFMAIATRQAAASEQGRLQGAVMAVQTCGQIVGPLIFAATYAAFETGRHPGAPGASFLVAAAVFGLALALAARLRAPAAGA